MLPLDKARSSGVVSSLNSDMWRIYWRVLLEEEVWGVEGKRVLIGDEVLGLGLEGFGHVRFEGSAGIY